MSRPINFLQLCTCGHYGNVHDDSTTSGVPGHGPCAMPGCTCMKFTWVGPHHQNTESELPLTKAIAPDDDRSWCSRCGGRDPECYICGPFRDKSLQ